MGKKCSKAKSRKQQQVRVFIKENAKEERRKLVWVSYGIFIAVLPFMDSYEIVCLQSANKFCYDIAVSRVQISIRTDEIFYFTYPKPSALTKSVVSYSKARGINVLSVNKDMANWCSLQVGPKSIFQYFYIGTSCRMLTVVENDEFSTQQLTPLTDRSVAYPGMCLLNAKFVFVTGGLCDVEPTAKCHRYDIDRNIWQEMPHLNEARMYPGSYQLAGHIYVFCGQNGQNRRNINSVERLSIESDPNKQVEKRWELIPQKNVVSLPCFHAPFTIPLNDSEILLLGGVQYGEPKVQLYDVRTDTAQSVHIHGAFRLCNFHGSNVPIAKISETNKVVALVHNEGNFNPCMIQFKKDTCTITILKQF